MRPAAVHLHWRFFTRVVCTILFFISVLALGAFAQPNIPVGTWRLHLSYYSIKTVALHDNLVIAAASGGILVYDRDDKTLTTFNTLNGLTSTGITCLGFDAARNQIVVGYEDGNLDFIKDNIVSNFDRFSTSTIPGPKRINDIAILGNNAYISTDFGIAVFNLDHPELKETWRDLGMSGSSLSIRKTVFLNDSIFAATSSGIISGDLDDNLLDFNAWNRHNAGTFSGPVASIETFAGQVYAAVDGDGLYQYSSGTWTKSDLLTGATFRSLEASANTLHIAEGQNLWSLTAAGTLDAIDDPVIQSPVMALADDQGHLWIADDQNGLLSNQEGTMKTYSPNGPRISSARRMKFHNGRMYALPGEDETGSLSDPILDFFENGSWSTQPILVHNATDIDFSGNTEFIASFGDGLQQSITGTATVFDHTNSPLFNEDPAGKLVLIPAIEAAAEGLWVANSGSATPLHLYADNSWESFSLPGAARFVRDLAVDAEGNVWMALDPAQGGGLMIFDPSSNNTVFRNEAAGNGALPSPLVHALTPDHDGNMWIGTSEGVAYFLTAGSDAIRPIFENRFLLQNEKITAIEVDGGNRKWIGTERGIWLFDAAGEELVQNFTTENSPLLSGNIRGIEIDDNTGEVFISTDNGILSYRGDATAAGQDFGHLRIFPNPVTASFNGLIAISGLAMNALVKITDVSGNLVWETRANGGTATWSGRGQNGKRAARGIYLVFAATENGAESAVGKIAVVD